tara:strand:- start:576 stop:1463 length:888 start_codon:yes stop_codon:yes gene_type:complete
MISLPKNVDPIALLCNLRELSWNVSDVLQSYNNDLISQEEFTKKLDVKNLSKGLVTIADLEVSNLIKEKLRDLYPNIGWEFLSEEDENKRDKNIKNQWVWIIDPLDGTNDFVNRTGEFATHIALYFKKEIILGIVLIPSDEKLWIYFEGIGTWCEDRNAQKVTNFKREFMSFNEITILTSKSHTHPQLQSLIKSLNPKRIVGMGSVGYKVASILKGYGDLYISFSLPNSSCPKDWDMAAPSSIIRGAGGHFTDVHGSNIEFLKNDNYEQGGIILSSMNKNHQGLCKEILENLKNI